ncbi:MAG: PEPxxWA-CTERM sorting domain-containing protein [Alphaproteobacteria bacterium]|nr:PEPxxWA-CTERM sorting domain-containing protein [Alphaproteobacteria bacterium]MBU2094922.1 PEPxxWA-CTERM sorting domain-containing protein [Alphaproteobacteria bacterium]MBU2305931.1 PEPxxWA-CTERM sorting domain-containing protein [Alphaproteobacteria bacterium]
MRGIFKSALPALAFAFTMAAAAPSHALSYFLDYASMDTSRSAVIKKNGDTFATVKMAPVNFTVFYGTGNTPQTGALAGPMTMIGWCVDIFHSISMGNIDLKYDNNYDLETNSKYTSNVAWAGESDLTDAQIDQVGRLVHYGTQLYLTAANSTAKLNELSGIQGAIWTVINKAQGYTVESTATGNAYGNTSNKSVINSFITKYSGSNYASYIPMNIGLEVEFLSETGKYGTKNAHQSFAFVPEPGTWALMILGFGGAGVMLRRQRKYALAA